MTFNLKGIIGRAVVLGPKLSRAPICLVCQMHLDQRASISLPSGMCLVSPRLMNKKKQAQRLRNGMKMQQRR